MKFKNTVYVWVEDLEMPLSVDYVPDWTLQKAVGETLQNAYDEALLSGGKAFVTDECSGTYVRDTGRGCDWQQIILIGDSGKRGENGATGKHGEGEIISFLVAARLGITKIMASRDWLLRGIIRRNEYGKQVLFLERWRTRHGRERKGTRWHYSPGDSSEHPDTDKIANIHAAFRYGKQRFANHAACVKAPQKIFASPRSCLMNNGLMVGSYNQLVLGYNLTANPGRDRAVFSLDDPDIMGEIRAIFEAHATARELAVVLNSGVYGVSRLEFSFQGRHIDPAEVKKAVSRVKRDRGIDHLAWGQVNSDTAMIADAKEQHRGKISILIFHDDVPLWIQAGVPHVSNIVKRRSNTSTKKIMAKDFHEAAWLLINDVIQMPRAVTGGIEMHTTLGSDVSATAVMGSHMIRYAWQYARIMDVRELFSVTCHELAHLTSGADDCTRMHTREISRIMGKASMNLATDAKARKAWKMASTRMQRFNRSKKGA